MGKNFCRIEYKWCKYLKRGNCTYVNSNIDCINRCPRIAEIETVRLADLLKEVSFDNAFNSICKWFINQEQNKNGYKEVYDKLLLMTPKKHNLNDLFIDVDLVEEDGKNWIDVSGKDLKKNTRYGIEFCEWIDWISMFITKDSFDKFSKEDIVGACMWEMTFYGFNENNVKSFHDKMISSLEEALEKEKQSTKNL